MLESAKRPESRVAEIPTRRRFTVEYKVKILEEADRCEKNGDLGALLRREGLYSSHIANWRNARDKAGLAGLKQAKRGPKPNPQLALEKENEKLRRQLALENARVR